MSRAISVPICKAVSVSGTPTATRVTHLHRVLSLGEEVEERPHIALHLHILLIRRLIQRRDLPRLKLDQVLGVGFPVDLDGEGVEVHFRVECRERFEQFVVRRRLFVFGFTGEDVLLDEFGVAEVWVLGEGLPVERRSAERMATREERGRTNFRSNVRKSLGSWTSSTSFR